MKNCRIAVFLGFIALLTGCGDSGSDGGSVPSLVANAGPDQSVTEGASVALSGAGSTGGIVDYTWEQVSGPDAALADADQVSASFTTPAIDHSAVLVFRLTVTGAQGTNSSDEVSIAVTALSPIMITTSGKFQALDENGVFAFKGMRYAAPPVASLRWRPPAAPTVFDGVVTADYFGPSCPAPPRQTGSTSSQNESEDCLFLNVWTPTPSETARLPVFVWIHGGAFVRGSASDALYDGQNLARNHDVVVVSFDYRLGVLGFLAHPDLSAEDPAGVSGNYGLQDQIAALQWVHDNISQFGGDPQNITVAGESAGAISVCDLMVSPKADGLFGRAIMESGFCSDQLNTLKGGSQSAENSGVDVQAELGCDAASDALACMRSISAAEIVQMTSGSQDNYGQLASAFKFGPIIDDQVLVDQPIDVLVRGEGMKVPLLIGSNRNEATFFRLATRQAVSTVGDYEQFLEQFDNDANSVLDEPSSTLLTYYPASNDSEALDAYEQFLTDAFFTCPVRSVARAMTNNFISVYQYEFARTPPFMAGRGAIHGIEIPYVFGWVGGDRYDSTDGVLSEAIQSYWASFAQLGNPNTGRDAFWPEYDLTQQEYQELNDVIEAKAGLKQAECDVIDTLRLSSPL